MSEPNTPWHDGFRQGEARAVKATQSEIFTNIHRIAGRLSLSERLMLLHLAAAIIDVRLEDIEMRFDRETSE